MSRSSDRSRLHRLALLGASLLMAVTGCRRGAGSESAAGTAASGSRLGIAQVLVPDSAGLRRYLETVDTVRGATAELRWSPNTVRLDRVETLRSLRRVSRDGAAFTFDAAEPKIRGLAPGRVLLVWGIALRKVRALEPRGGVIVVRTDPVSLPEAIEEGRIEWKSRAGFARGLLSPGAPETDSVRRHAAARTPPGLVRFASYGLLATGGAGPPVQEEAPGETPEPEDKGEGELPHHAEGEIGGYEFEVGYGWDRAKLQFQLEARKGEPQAFDEPEEAQGERTRAHGTRGAGGKGLEPEERPLTAEEKKRAREHEELEQHTRQGIGEIEHPGGLLTPKGLFGLAAEAFDLRIRVRGHLDDFATEGRLAIHNAALGNFRLAISELRGEADLDWVARLGAPGTFSENIKVEVPWYFDIPLLIAGIPFVVEIGVNFLAAPALTSQYASAAGGYHIAFQGSATVTATPASADAEGDLSGTPEVSQRQITSLGVSGVLVAAQVPRVGFGLGLFNTSAVAYVDHVLATSIVTAGGTSLIPCRRYQINSSFGAGVAVQLLGIKIPGLSQKKLLKQPFDTVITEPPGANCKV